MLGREFLGLIIEELGKSLAIDIGGDDGARVPGRSLLRTCSMILRAQVARLQVRHPWSTVRCGKKIAVEAVVVNIGGS